MTEPVAVDTDVLLKAAAYRVAAEFVQVIARTGPPAFLGLTHLIAERQLRRKKNLRDKEGAAAELRDLLGVCETLEPDEREIQIAAGLAELAQSNSLPLDTGEAQLAAILANRALPLMVTGDKRALGALTQLLADAVVRAQFVCRLACFEQVMQAIAALVGENEIRNRVCTEPDIDGAMRLACSCGSPVWNPAQLQEACTSFIGQVRREIGDLLVANLPLA